MAGELEEKIALVTGDSWELGSRRRRSFLLRTMQAVSGVERFADGGTVQVG